jgi:hypothetical protein
MASYENTGGDSPPDFFETLKQRRETFREHRLWLATMQQSSREFFEQLCAQRLTACKRGNVLRCVTREQMRESRRLIAEYQKLAFECLEMRSSKKQ